MIQLFHNAKYCSWSIDLSKFNTRSSFDIDLNNSFKKTINEPLPPEAKGLAYSTDVDNIKGFLNLLDFVSPSLSLYFELLTGTNKKKIVRAWANRMHQNSYGAIHSHRENLKIFVLYYNIPKDSGNIILIDPKYKKLDIKDPNLIPEKDKIIIKVKEGLCLLHDGEIMHGVLTHKSDTVRDSIIIEYQSLNNT